MGSEKIGADKPPVALQGSSQHVMLLKDKKNICCLESDNFPLKVPGLEDAEGELALSSDPYFFK